MTYILSKMLGGVHCSVINYTICTSWHLVQLIESRRFQHLPQILAFVHEFSTWLNSCHRKERITLMNYLTGKDWAQKLVYLSLIKQLAISRGHLKYIIIFVCLSEFIFLYTSKGSDRTVNTVINRLHNIWNANFSDKC